MNPGLRTVILCGAVVLSLTITRSADAQGALGDGHALDGGIPDAILVTGDIAEDQTSGAYQMLRDILEPAGCPVYCLPGNHDDPALMQEMLDDDQFHYCETLNHGA